MSNLLLLGAGGPVAGGGGGPTLLVHDEFTDPNGTNLNAHTISPTNTPATSWTHHIGGYSIQSNRAQASAGNATAGCDPGDASCTVEAVVNRAGNGATGPYVRGSDGNNFWLGGTGPTALNLFEKNGGSFTSRASGSISIGSSTDHTVKLTANGTTITAYVNGVQVAQYTSATFNQTATQCGIRAGDGSDRFDDFKVWDA